jgi:hypothetical protein
LVDGYDVEIAMPMHYFLIDHESSRRLPFNRRNSGFFRVVATEKNAISTPFFAL